MDALLSKLTNLGYELFGIFIPGFGMLLGILSLWFAAGPSVELLGVPHLTIERFVVAIEVLKNVNPLLILLVLTIVSYPVGHFLKWISKSGDEKLTRDDKPRKKLWLLLKWRVPKGAASYKPELESLYKSVYLKLFPDDTGDESWVKFYGVSKAILSERASFSLQPTYQNKYTMHRSLSSAAVICSWVGLVIVIVGIVSLFCDTIPTPHMGVAVALFGFAAYSRYQLWRSFQYNWTLWGDTVICETYAHLVALPRHDRD